MKSSHPTSYLSDFPEGEAIPVGTLAYFHARLKNRLFNFVLSKFVEKEESEGLTKAELARRIGKRPEVITRLLGAPGNWSIETVSDLLLGIAGEELELQSASIRQPKSNVMHKPWVEELVAPAKKINETSANATISEQNLADKKKPSSISSPWASAKFQIVEAGEMAL